MNDAGAGGGEVVDVIGFDPDAVHETRVPVEHAGLLRVTEAI